MALQQQLKSEMACCILELFIKQTLLIVNDFLMRFLWDYSSKLHYCILISDLSFINSFHPIG